MTEEEMYASINKCNKKVDEFGDILVGNLINDITFRMELLKEELAKEIMILKYSKEEHNNE